jgi:hypothetical protein
MGAPRSSTRSRRGDTAAQLRRLVELERRRAGETVQGPRRLKGGTCQWIGIVGPPFGSGEYLGRRQTSPGTPGGKRARQRAAWRV